MGGGIIQILVILLLLFANGLFAMSEMAVVSARKARLQQAADEGSASARRALELALHPGEFLSTVQIGITLIGILAGAFGSATIAKSIAAGLASIPVLAPYGEAIGVVIVVLMITYLSLVIGELAPKRLALNRPEELAAAVARPMEILSKLASPAVRFLTASTDIVLKVIGLRASNEPPVTEEEVKVLIEQGTQVGVFQESEQDMIEGVLRLGEQRIGAVMTPRVQIVWIDDQEPAEEIYRKVIDSHHSRFPVARETLESVEGIVLAKDLLAQHLRGEPLDLHALIRETLFVPGTTPALRVLELFKEKGTHAAMVIDEYGSVQGLATPTDILEDIVGHVAFAGAPAEPQAVQREDGSWLLDGLLPIDRLKETFGLPELSDEQAGAYQTVGGFVIHELGAIPTTGQSLELNDLRIEVVDMDGHRVDKVLVVRRSAGGEGRPPQ